MNPLPPTEPRASIQDRVTQACDWFEAAWRAGSRPQLPQFLALAEAADQHALLTALVAIDAAYRRKAGESPIVADYASLPGADADTISRILAGVPARSGEGLAATGAYSSTSLRDGSASGTPRVFAGTPVPGFELLAELGRGGMGVVYKAREVKLNRVVALKLVLESDRTGRQDLMRFLAEAEAVAAINNPHVVRIFAYGEVDARPYIAFEYLPGGSLADFLRNTGSLSGQAAADMVRKIALGVAAAHALGIVHRDLKPGNVLLDERSEPKVADFGLAKRGQNDLTRTGAIMGTPSYMAPEQAKGASKFVGPQADVWALGVILYECLTATRPFEGDSPHAVIRQLIDDIPEPPSRRAGQVPRDLEQICLKCLEKAPADRYSDTAELAADLEHFLAGEPVSVRPAGRLVRLYKWAKRKPVLAGLYASCAALIFLLTFGGIVAGLWLDADDSRKKAEFERGNADTARQSAETAQKNAETARGQAETARDQLKEEKKQTEMARDALKIANAELDELRDRAERNEYGKMIELARRLVQEKRFTEAQRLLERCKLSLRGWEWQFVHRLCWPERVTIDEGLENFGISPDASRLAGMHATGMGITAPMIWDARKGTRLATMFFNPFERENWFGLPTYHVDPKMNPFAMQAASLQHKPGDYVFTPDGSRIVTLHSQYVIVWDARTGRRLTKFDRGRTENGFNGSWTLAVNRETAVIVRWNGDGVEFCDPMTGKTRSRPLKLPAGISPVSTTPDGERLLGISNDGEMRVWETATGKELMAALTGEKKRPIALLSPDGITIATIGSDVRLWRVETGESFITLPATTGNFLRFNRDSSRLLTLSRGKVELWDTENGAWVAEAPLVEGVATGSDVQFTPDGKHFAVCHGSTLTLYESEKGGAIRSFTGSSIMASQLGVAQPVFRSSSNLPMYPTFRFTPDGQWLVTSSHERVGVWDLSVEPSPKRVLATDPKNGNMTATFSPDGRAVLVSGYASTARILDADTGAELQTFEHTGWPLCASYTQDGNKVVTGGRSEVRLWDVASGKPITTVKIGEQPNLPGHGALTSDGSRIVTWVFADALTGQAGKDLQVRVWDAGSGKLLFAVPGYVVSGGVSMHVRLSPLSPDGTRLVTRTPDQHFRIWNAKTGKEQFHVNVANAAFYGSAVEPYWPVFSTDGSRIVFVNYERSQAPGLGLEITFRVYDANRGVELFTIRGTSGSVPWAVFSPDGTRLFAGGRMLDAQTGAEIAGFRSPDDLGMSSPAFSPDGSRILAVSEDEVRIWDAKTGGELLDIRSTKPMKFGISWFEMRDSRLLISGAANQLALWDVTPVNVSFRRESPGGVGHAILAGSATLIDRNALPIKGPAIASAEGRFAAQDLIDRGLMVEPESAEGERWRAVPGFKLPLKNFVPRKADLGQGRLTDDLLALIGKARGLRDLRLIQFNSKPATSSRGFANLAELTELEFLQLDGTGIRDDDLHSLQGLSKLKQLFVSRTELTGTGFAHLTALPVERLSIGTRLSDAGAVEIGKLKALRHLAVEGSDQFTERGIRALGQLPLREFLVMVRSESMLQAATTTWPKLELLDLNGSRIVEDAWLRHLVNLKNIREINLAFTNVTDAGLIHLEGLTTLKKLIVTGTKVTRAGIDKLRVKLPGLHEVGAGN